MLFAVPNCAKTRREIVTHSSKFLLVVIMSYVVSGCGGDSSDGDQITPSVNDITSGLIAYYPFNGNANDESGNGKDGVVAGPVLIDDRNGKNISAYAFDGFDDIITIPVNINPDVLPQATITVWARVDVDTDFNVVISHDKVDSRGFDRSITVDNRGGGKGWSVFSGTGSVLGFEPVNAGVWVFLAAVYDQAAGTVKLFVNNKKFEKAGTLFSGYDTTTIGANPGYSPLANAGYFNGAIDDVRIYNRALTQSEIQEISGL